VHIDPEDDETSSPCDHLPLRDALLPILRKHWEDLSAAQSIETAVGQAIDASFRTGDIATNATEEKIVGTKAMTTAILSYL